MSFSPGLTQHVCVFRYFKFIEHNETENKNLNFGHHYLRWYTEGKIDHFNYINSFEFTHFRDLIDNDKIEFRSTGIIEMLGICYFFEFFSFTCGKKVCASTLPPPNPRA